MNGIVIMADSHHGVYIPKLFAEALEGEDNFKGISQEQLDILLQGPEHEWYWETWDEILNNGEIIDENKSVWRLHHDGDLFAYCEEMMTEEEKINLFGEEI